MIFKSALINSSDLNFNRNVNSEKLGKFIQDYSLYRGYVAFKTKRYRSSSQYGVEMDDQELPLDEAVKGGKIIDIKFFIIHLNTRTVFYDGNKTELERILKIFFSVDHADIYSEISFDDLVNITTMRLVDVGEGNISLFTEDEMAVEHDVLELGDVVQVKSLTRQIEFQSVSGLKPSKVKKFVEKNNTGTKRIYLTGSDKYGNQLISDGEGQLSRKIIVIDKNLTWMEKKDLAWSELIDELQASMRNGK